MIDGKRSENKRSGAITSLSANNNLIIQDVKRMKFEHLTVDGLDIKRKLDL